MATRSESPVAVMTGALEHAAKALSAFLGDRMFEPTHVTIATYPLAELPALYGPEETPVVCSAFEVDDGNRGVLLLLLPLEQADEVVRSLLGEPAADEALADSIFGEMGNIVGSSFLNYVADRLQLRIQLSPPHVSRDMVGALLATVAGASAAIIGEQIPVVQTELIDADGAELSAYLLWVPGNAGLNGWEVQV